MARWTGTWLGGVGAAGVPTGHPDEPRGVRLGLPAYGRGAVATFGSRAAAFAIDTVLSGLVARLFFHVQSDSSSTYVSLPPLIALALLYVVGLALTGQTPGMRLLRLRVVPVAASTAAVRLVPAALRTALLMLLVPALVSDRDGRGLHDLAAGTVVVRA